MTGRGGALRGKGRGARGPGGGPGGRGAPRPGQVRGAQLHFFFWLSGE